jgi:hypothetical protein
MSSMAEAGSPYNGTLWAVGSPREITCFRVQVDDTGQVVTTSVHDLNRASGGADFDGTLRHKLTERYGDGIAITVVADGGAGYDYFRQEVTAGQYPVPPGTEAKRESGGAWQETPESDAS